MPLARLPFAASIALFALCRLACKLRARKTSVKSRPRRRKCSCPTRRWSSGRRRRWSTSMPRGVVENRNPFMDDPLFRRFFGARRRGEQVQRSLGSGVIVDPAGLVVTNNHVIEGASEVKVALSDKREFEAEIVLKDERTDLAVLRAEGREREISRRSTSPIPTSCRSATWCWRSAIRSASARP